MKKNIALLLIVATIIASVLSCDLIQKKSVVHEVETDVSKLNTITVEKLSLEENQLSVDYAWVPSQKKVSLISVGDIMGHTAQLLAAKTELGYDFTEQFKYIEPVLSSRDFAIGNLETVFAGESAKYSGKNMIFNSPDALGEAIKKAGFDILTTANNHSLDRGYKGLKRTLEVLDALGIMHAGTGRTKEEAEKILTFEKEGITFALLSYSYSTNGWPMPADHPYALNMLEEAKIISDIKAAKELGVDFILVGTHWGLEYHLNENIHQERLAENLFYAGADIILGTHPHVIQPFEHRTMVDESGDEKDKFIIYSQGNFVSGQTTYPRAIGMHITFDFIKKNDEKPYVDQVSVMPTYVETTGPSSKPYMRILDTRKSVMDHENGDMQLSNALISKLKTFEFDFLSHINSKSDQTPYLNERGDYVIYDKKTN